MTANGTWEIPEKMEVSLWMATKLVLRPRGLRSDWVRAGGAPCGHRELDPVLDGHTGSHYQASLELAVR